MCVVLTVLTTIAVFAVVFLGMVWVTNKVEAAYGRQGVELMIVYGLSLSAILWVTSVILIILGAIN